VYPALVPLAPQLMQKGGLACPAHANYRCGLAGEAHGPVDAPWRGGWKRHSQRSGELLGKQRAQWLGSIVSHAPYFLLFKGRKSRFFLLLERTKSWATFWFGHAAYRMPLHLVALRCERHREIGDA